MSGTLLMATDSTYHADGLSEQITLNCSTAKTILERSPYHAWAEHPRLGNLCRREATPEMERGTLIHSLVLHVMGSIQVGEFADYRTKAAQEWRDVVKTQGGTPVLQRDVDAVMPIVRSVSEFQRVHLNDAFTYGDNEVAALWDDDGVACRARLDCLDTREQAIVIYDLKTCQSASTKAIRTSVARYGYHVQAAMYSRAVKAVYPNRPVQFVFVFVETQAPYAVQAVTLDAYSLGVGVDMFLAARDIWRHGLTWGEWPSYSDGVVEIGLPRWAETFEEVA